METRKVSLILEVTVTYDPIQHGYYEAVNQVLSHTELGTDDDGYMPLEIVRKTWKDGWEEGNE